MSDKTLQFGVNLNNREPLIAPDYDLQALLGLSTVVEDSGFDSVWVGDSLFSKPRYEPLALLAAISQRTSQEQKTSQQQRVGFHHPLHLQDRCIQIRLQLRKRHVHDGPIDECHARTENGRQENPSSRRLSARGRGCFRKHETLVTRLS